MSTANNTHDAEAPLLANGAQSGTPLLDEELGHTHLSHRSPWLRAMVLGANDGLVSVASLMFGVAAASSDRRTLLLSGLSGTVAGALSMAVGEYISVSSQRDSEQADIRKEIAEHNKGEAARRQELEELTQIFMDRGLDRPLASEVAQQLTAKDAIRAHAREELGIDLDELANPFQAAFTSCLAFTLGALIPLLTGYFVKQEEWRSTAVGIASTIGLALFGIGGAVLGGASPWKGGIRVLIGGWLAMLLTFAVGKLFGEPAEP